MRHADLTWEEVVVLKAVFLRDLDHGFAPVDTDEARPGALSNTVFNLRALRLIDAELSPSRGWIPGNVTPKGRAWMKAYGLTCDKSPARKRPA